MVSIKLFKFNKKVNSTKTPNDNGLLLDCLIKTQSSIINPVIEIKTNPIDYNYCYIEKFKRYYFISDIVYNLGTWLVTLNIDVLASFKSDILGSNQYILRSASDYNDDILDTIYPTKASSSGNQAVSYAPNSVIDVDNSSTISNYFNVAYQNGYFVIGVISGNNSGITYYQLTYTGFKQVLQSLMAYVPGDMTDVSSGIAKSLFDPLQYIVSCYWIPIPFNVTYLPTPISINFGGYSILINGSQNATPIFARKSHLRTTIAVPKHPQADDFSYLQLEPYSRYNLLFEPFGYLALDSTKLYGASNIRLDWYVDIATMDAELFVYNNESEALINIMRANIGVQIPMTQITIDALGSINSITGGVSSMASALFDGNIGGAITGAISGITSTINSMLPQLSMNGTISSFISYSLGSPQLHAFYNLIVDTNNSKYGRPLCENKTLNNLSGYCLCDKAVITSLCTGDEKEIIESYLNSGFYIE